MVICYKQNSIFMVNNQTMAESLQVFKLLMN